MKNTLRRLLSLAVVCGFGFSLNARTLANSAEVATAAIGGVAQLAEARLHSADDAKSATIAGLTSHALKLVSAALHVNNTYAAGKDVLSLVTSERENAYTLGWAAHHAHEVVRLAKLLHAGDVDSPAEFKTNLHKQLHDVVLPVVETAAAVVFAHNDATTDEVRKQRRQLASVQSALGLLRQVVASDLETQAGRNRAAGLVAHVVLTLGEFFGGDNSAGTSGIDALIAGLKTKVACSSCTKAADNIPALEPVPTSDEDSKDA